MTPRAPSERTGSRAKLAKQEYVLPDGSRRSGGRRLTCHSLFHSPEAATSVTQRLEGRGSGSLPRPLRGPASRVSLLSPKRQARKPVFGEMQERPGWPGPPCFSPVMRPAKSSDVSCGEKLSRRFSSEAKRAAWT